jgi:hypothetical protein
VHRRLAAEMRPRRRQLAPAADTGPAVAIAEPLPAGQSPVTSGLAGAGRSPVVPPHARPAVLDRQTCITVVSGLPRAGTSMLMQLLAAGGMPILSDGVRAADADNPRGYFEYEAAKRLRTDRAWLGDAAGKAVKIVAQLLPYLPADFTYKVLFIERDLEEVLASQQTMLARQARHGAQLEPARLRATFARQVQHVQDWLARQEHIETLYVSHHEGLADPHRLATTVNDFLGGDLNLAAMTAVIDQTLYRQRIASA